MGGGRRKAFFKALSSWQWAFLHFSGSRTGPSVFNSQFSRAFVEVDLASGLDPPPLLQETAVLMETDCMQFSAYFVQVWKLTPKITFLCK